MEFLSNFFRIVLLVVEVVLIFNLVIVVHELGHFLAARWRGLVVDRFGIWFGRPIWKKRYNGVDYCLGWIPAGGYVALPQMAPMEAIEGQNGENQKPLPAVSPVDKIIVAAAGPLFSMLLAFAFAFLIMIIGKPVSQGEESTVVGYVVPRMPAADAVCSTPGVEPGLKVGDKILEVDGHPVARFGGGTNDGIRWRIVRSEGNEIRFVVERDGKRLEFTSSFERAKTPFWERSAMREVGILPEQQPMVGQIAAGSIAEKAGLKPSDIVMAVDGQTVYSQMGFDQLLGETPDPTPIVTVRRKISGGREELLKIPFPAVHPRIEGISQAPNSPSLAAGLKVGDQVLAIDGGPIWSVESMIKTIESSSGAPVAVSILRDNKPLDIMVQPTVIKIDGDQQPGRKIGVELSSPTGITWDRYGETVVGPSNPLYEVKAAVSSIANMVGALLSPKSDIKITHMGGPVQITRAYYMFLDSPEGWRRALWFSIFLNVNLAIMNLLPLPVLDGGHILLSTIEWLRRRPLSVYVMERLQYSCALLLIGFILFVSYYDFGELTFFRGHQPSYEYMPPGTSN